VANECCKLCGVAGLGSRAVRTDSFHHPQFSAVDKAQR